MTALKPSGIPTPAPTTASLFWHASPSVVTGVATADTVPTTLEVLLVPTELACVWVQVAVAVSIIVAVLVNVAIFLMTVPAAISIVSPEAQLPFEVGKSQHHCSDVRLKLPAPHALGTMGQPPVGLPAIFMLAF